MVCTTMVHRHLMLRTIRQPASMDMWSIGLQHQDLTKHHMRLARPSLMSKGDQRATLSFPLTRRNRNPLREVHTNSTSHWARCALTPLLWHRAYKDILILSHIAIFKVSPSQATHRMSLQDCLFDLCSYVPGRSYIPQQRTVLATTSHYRPCILLHQRRLPHTLHMVPRRGFPSHRLPKPHPCPHLQARKAVP
jgi:hypothetical protein